MNPSRFKNPLIIAHIVCLVLSIPIIFGLTATYAMQELSSYQAVAMTIFVIFYLFTNVLAGLAFRRIGQSPYWAFTALVMGLIPLILYAVLPDKSNQAA